MLEGVCGRDADERDEGGRDACEELPRDVGRVGGTVFAERGPACCSGVGAPKGELLVAPGSLLPAFSDAAGPLPGRAGSFPKVTSHAVGLLGAIFDGSEVSIGGSRRFNNDAVKWDTLLVGR